MGGPLLAVLFVPAHRRLSRHVAPRWSALMIVALGLFAVLVPTALVITLLVSEAPDALGGAEARQVMAAIRALHVGGIAVGPELAKVSSELVTWLSRQAVALAGGVTRMAVNALMAFLGLYYLLMSGETVWEFATSVVPFSRPTMDRLRERFTSVTDAMLIGIALTAVAQGTIVGVAFAIVGLDHPVLWGVLTGVASVLPVFGSALVWLPGVAVLLIQGRTGAAIVLAAIGGIVASNIDNVIRPVVYRRASGLHPMLTIVGAFIGLKAFGLLGVLVGPLALAYFIELVQAFRQDYVTPTEPPVSAG